MLYEIQTAFSRIRTWVTMSISADDNHCMTNASLVTYCLRKNKYLLCKGVWERATPFPGLLHVTLDPYFIMLSAKQSGIKYHFWVFDMTRPGIQPQSPRPLVKFKLQSHYHIHFRNHHHQQHVVLVTRISLTLSRHFSLSFIASSRSSGQHPVSSHSCWIYVRAGRPAFARPCVGVHKSTSLMTSSLLLQQCPACLVRLTWIVFVIGGRWPYSWCLVGCCRQDLFKIARSILV